MISHFPGLLVDTNDQFSTLISMLGIRGLKCHYLLIVMLFMQALGKHYTSQQTTVNKNCQLNESQWLALLTEVFIGFFCFLVFFKALYVLHLLLLSAPASPSNYCFTVFFNCCFNHPESDIRICLLSSLFFSWKSFSNTTAHHNILELVKNTIHFLNIPFAVCY